ncbi:hypothetical protein [Streptomyces sp. NPDC057460]|uniref:hypothetical protein n=1 Tax=Streptomyces sp. NPDC057460 TaxID=3346141 RepID=UPI0036853E35
MDWTFSSEYAPESTKLPISVVRRVPVTVKGAAAGRNLKSLNVWVSYDKGANWETATVRDGRVQVTNPKAGGSVSFETEAVDRQGNSVSETIVNAYLTK